MNRDIQEIIETINGNYLQLLKKFKIESISLDGIGPVIDEINIFWEIHKKNALFVIKNISEYDFDTVFFTCASGIEICDHEYEPFLLSGKNRIYDDKLPTYFDVLTKCDDFLKEKCLSEIKYIVSNYIELMEKSLSFVFFVPISFFLLIPEEISKLTHNLFLDLFSNEIASIDEYFTKIKNEEDFDLFIQRDNAKLLILSNNEKQNDSLINKVKLFNGSPIPNPSFPERAYFALTTAISNSLACISVSAKTGFIPYLRNKVAFNNVVIISDNVFSQIKELNEAMPHFTIIVVYLHMFYRYLNFDKFDGSLKELNDCLSFLEFILNEKDSLPDSNAFKINNFYQLLDIYFKESHLENYNIEKTY